MLLRPAHRLLALLLCLGMPLGAWAQDEEAARIRKVRGLYAEVQEATKGPPTVERKSKAKPTQWYRLRTWEAPGWPKGTLHKVVVNSRDPSGGELERAFYLKDDLLFFAHYVTTSPGSAKARKRDEERMYFDDTTGTPIRWQHNQDIQPMSGHALRWGEQARSDAKVALSLARDKASTERFVPISCISGFAECRTDMGGDYCPQQNSLYPPPGLPVRKDLCMDQPWFAGMEVTCSFEQEGLTLTVTESFRQACPDDIEDCASSGSKETKIDLTPELGRVKECPVLNE